MAEQRPEDGYTPRPRRTMTHHAHLSRRPGSTPRLRRNGKKGPRKILLARRTSVDRTICQRMCSLPAEQEPHTLSKGPPIQNHGTLGHPPFCPSGHGPNHRAADKPGLRQHSNYSQSWVLTSGNLSAVPENDHGTPNCAALLQAPLPVVRTPQVPDNRLRPPIHLPLQPSPRKRARHHMELIYSISPPDRRADRTEEPVG